LDLFRLISGIPRFSKNTNFSVQWVSFVIGIISSSILSNEVSFQSQKVLSLKNDKALKKDKTPFDFCTILQVIYNFEGNLKPNIIECKV